MEINIYEIINMYKNLNRKQQLLIDNLIEISYQIVYLKKNSKNSKIKKKKPEARSKGYCAIHFI